MSGVGTASTFEGTLYDGRSAVGRRVVIKVEGKEGASYSLDGVFDPGFVKAGPPPAKDKTAKPKKAAKPVA